MHPFGLQILRPRPPQWEGATPSLNQPPVGTACQQMAATPPSWSLLFHTWSLLLQMLTKTLIACCNYTSSHTSCQTNNSDLRITYQNKKSKVHCMIINAVLQTYCLNFPHRKLNVCKLDIKQTEDFKSSASSK